MPAEAEQSCRPAPRSGSEQTAAAPGASASSRGEAGRRQRRFVPCPCTAPLHERVAAARDGVRLGGTQTRARLTCTGRERCHHLWKPFYLPCFSKSFILWLWGVKFREAADVFFVSGRVSMGCTSAGSTSVSMLSCTARELNRFRAQRLGACRCPPGLVLERGGGERSTSAPRSSTGPRGHRSSRARSTCPHHAGSQLRAREKEQPEKGSEQTQILCTVTASTSSPSPAFG